MAELLHLDLHLDLLRWFREFCVAGAAMGTLYSLTAAALVLRFRRPTATSVARYPSVSVLKPLHGNEPGLFYRLVSFCRQDYPGALQIVCGTQREDDPAIETVALLKSTQNTEIDLVVDSRSHGANRKISNLANMQCRSRHEMVVLSDSDIVVTPSFLRTIAAELQQPNVGAVTCLYHGIATRGIWAQLSALHINMQFLPNVIVALSFNAAHPCFGSAIAMRQSTLERIGGLRPFGKEIADDYAIGRAIRAAGYKVAIPGFAVGHVCFERDFRALWQHLMRSARTIRSVDPIGYLGMCLMCPIVFAAGAAASGVRVPLLLIATSILSRIILCWSSARCLHLARQNYWLVPLHDIVSFAVFIGSLFGHSVVWRGHAYTIQDDGTVKNDPLAEPTISRPTD